MSSTKKKAIAARRRTGAKAAQVAKAKEVTIVLSSQGSSCTGKESSADGTSARDSDPCIVCVQDIRAGTTATQIEVALRKFGSVSRVRLQPAPTKGASALAFVEFNAEADAARCLRRTRVSRHGVPRETVSVNGQQLKIEQVKSSDRLARTDKPKDISTADGAIRIIDTVDESLREAKVYLASVEDRVAADVEASIAAAGGCMKRDDLGAVVKGRLTTSLTVWLRSKPNRFTLQEELGTGMCVVKERVGTLTRLHTS